MTAARRHQTRSRRARRALPGHGRELAVASVAVANGAPIAYAWDRPDDGGLWALDADWPLDADGNLDDGTPDDLVTVCVHCLRLLHPTNRAALTQVRRTGMFGVGHFR